MLTMLCLTDNTDANEDEHGAMKVRMGMDEQSRERGQTNEGKGQTRGSNEGENEDGQMSATARTDEARAQ